MLDDTIMPGEMLLIPIIDQCVNPNIAIINQTQDFTITHALEQPSPQVEEVKAPDSSRK